MKEITMLLDKINEGTLTASDLSAFAAITKDRVQQGTPGYEKISRDDIQWLETYAYALKKYELFLNGEGYDLRGGDWREALQDVGKLKSLLDELEAIKLVAHVSWYIDGIALFDIPDADSYKKEVYKVIRNHLEKIMKKGK